MFAAVLAVPRAGRTLLTLFAVAALAAVGAAKAGAATQRYAAQGGAGVACTQVAPCGIEVAIEGAANGDEVIVEAGILAAGANRIDATASNLSIHGVSAGAKPEITSSASTVAVRVSGAGSTIRNLELTHTGSPAGTGLFLDGTLAERMEVNSPATYACELTNGATLRDSLCRSMTGGSGALGVVGAASTIGYARNVTAVATGAGSAGAIVYAAGPGTVELDALNIIAQGSPGSPDILTIADIPSGTAKATMGYSDYVITQAFGAGMSSITQAGTATNITALPQFVNAPLGDYRQLATSPTRNAGATDPRTGTLDFEGEARPQAAIDIGADEFTEPLPAAPDTTPPATTIDKGPKKKSKSKKATFLFSSDEAGATFECKLDKGAFETCTSPAKYKKLKKGKHTFSVRATDGPGNVDATPATLKWKVKKRKK